MGSVMDQERPWERPMRERIENAYRYGGGRHSGLEAVMKQIINELERLEGLINGGSGSAHIRGAAQASTNVPLHDPNKTDDGYC